TLEVRLPPLRERTDDIVPLARTFLASAARHYKRDTLRLSASAERALTSWRWPGNVRELQHLMERAALLAEHGEVNDTALAFGSQIEPTRDFDGMTLDEAEAWLVQRALERHAGSLQRTAEALGISRQSLYRRLEKHGLSNPDDDAD
ncbi:MAG TPA: helix-turn-helix domain-containing protein, partial [Rhodanobacteraceae bacterium]|nr:helix-turn-helix domain-containing protein [Rhodanobacteraceae bacterium]